MTRVMRSARSDQTNVTAIKDLVLWETDSKREKNVGVIFSLSHIFKE
jgi:hypothetical protein